MLGFRIKYFDTAPWYGFGRSERGRRPTEKSQFVISSKVGRFKTGAVDNPSNYGMVDPLPFHPIYDYSYDGIMRSFEDGLQRLGLEHIDFLVHDIGEFQMVKKTTDISKIYPKLVTKPWMN